MIAMAEASVRVTGCVCGSPHVISGQAYEALQYATRGKPERQRVRLGGQCWLVPRLFIACHGLNGWTLAEQAAQYGWEEVSASGTGR